MIYKYKEKISLLLLITLIIFIYVFLRPYYKHDNVDNVWTLSFIYDFFYYNDRNARFFGFGFANLKVCGVIAGYIYAFILDTIGWTQKNAQLISTFFTYAGMAIWYFILKKLKFKKIFALSIILILLAIEPIYSVAGCARTDALIFFIMSAALVTFIYKHYFISSLLVMVGFETHPISISMISYMAAYATAYYKEIFLNKKELFKMFINMFAGASIGLLIYITLHFEYLNEFFTTISEGIGNDVALKNYIIEYFLKTKYYRHIPELVAILISLLIFIKNKLYQKSHNYNFILFCIIYVVVFSIFLPRNNYNYIIFSYPAFILLIGAVFWEYKTMFLLNIAIFCYLLPQYALVRVHFEKDYPGINKYVEIIEQNVPKEEVPLFGSYQMWYVFMGKRNFYHYTRIDDFNYKEFIVSASDKREIRFDVGVEAYVNNPELRCERINSFTFQNDVYNTYRCFRN